MLFGALHVRRWIVGGSSIPPADSKCSMDAPAPQHWPSKCHRAWTPPSRPFQCILTSWEGWTLDGQPWKKPNPSISPGNEKDGVHDPLDFNQLLAATTLRPGVDGAESQR